MYWFSLAVFRIIRGLLGISKTVVGREHIPLHGALIVVANHVGNTDSHRVSDALDPRYIHWWANDSLFSFRKLYAVHRHEGTSVILSCLTAMLFVPIVKYSGTVPVVRKQDGDSRYAAVVNRAALKRSKEILKRSGAIGIYVNGGLGLPNPHAGFAIVVMQLLREPLEIPVWVLPVEIRPEAVYIKEPIDGRELIKNRSAKVIAQEVWEKSIGCTAYAAA